MGLWRRLAGLPPELVPIPRVAADPDLPSIGVDLYRVAFDPHSGHMYAKGRLAFGLWGGHLIDCLLAGMLSVDDDTAEDVDDDSVLLNPLVQDAWCRVRAGLPREAYQCFWKDVAPINEAQDAITNCLAARGELGVPDPAVRRELLRPAQDDLRSAALRALASFSTITVAPGGGRLTGAYAAGPVGAAINSILAATEGARAAGFSSIGHISTAGLSGGGSGC